LSIQASIPESVQVFVVILEEGKNKDKTRQDKTRQTIRGREGEGEAREGKDKR
jgi:hypothetical protein